MHFCAERFNIITSILDCCCADCVKSFEKVELQRHARRSKHAKAIETNYSVFKKKRLILYQKREVVNFTSINPAASGLSIEELAY